MKRFLPVILLMLTSFCFSQKYVLLDKKMSQPVSYTNTVTVEHDYHHLFPVERTSIRQFISELEKLAAILSDNKKPKPESLDLNIGSTNIRALKIPLAAEERLDIVLTTNCGNVKASMHLSDAKFSNASNAYFINTWVKYIKSYIK